MKKSKKDIKNKKLPNKEQKKDELTDKELKGISGGTIGILSISDLPALGKEIEFNKEDFFRRKKIP